MNSKSGNRKLESLQTANAGFMEHVTQSLTSHNLIHSNNQQIISLITESINKLVIIQDNISKILNKKDKNSTKPIKRAFLEHCFVFIKDTLSKFWHNLTSPNFFAIWFTWVLLSIISSHSFSNFFHSIGNKFRKAEDNITKNTK